MPKQDLTGLWMVDASSTS